MRTIAAGRFRGGPETAKKIMWQMRLVFDRREKNMWSIDRMSAGADGRGVGGAVYTTARVETRRRSPRRFARAENS
jgi:hypothetical protein